LLLFFDIPFLLTNKSGDWMFKRSLLTAAAFASAAYAQPANLPPSDSAAPLSADSSREAYEAAYFAQYNPQTALDMINHTPGFSLDNGSSRRGFSGAVGNVLIDGARPAAKNQSVQSILSRIPASQVLRVEMLRGEATAGDASGQSVLANVVRTASAGDGVWEAGIEHTVRNRPSPHADVSWSGRRGQVDYGMGGSFFSSSRSHVGERLFTDPAGAPTGLRLERSPRFFDEYSSSANLSAPLMGGRLSVNGEVSGFRYHSNTQGPTLNLDDSVRAYDESLYEEEELAYELGANYERDFGAWTGTATALATRRRFVSDEDYTHTDYSPAASLLTRQAQRRTSGESILRATIARPLNAAQRVEFGIEGAINTLDAVLRLSEDDGTGPETLIIPNANVAVEEERAEAFLAHSWRFAERWSMESRLARESSTLTFTGDADKSVDLAFWKPSVQVTRDIGARSQLRARVYRDVGQLDFDDFVSAVAISDNRIAGGNPDLEPESSWRGELGADLRFANDVAVSLVYTHAQFENAADLVPVTIPGPNPGDPPIRFDAPGNIGEAQVDALNFSLSTPLTAIIPGGRFTLDLELFKGEVTDPLTGLRRESSGDEDLELEWEFRQDLPDWKMAWGVSYERESEATDFRLREIQIYEEGPWVDVFAETTVIPGVKITAIVINAISGQIKSERRFFSPDRSGVLTRVEQRERHFEDGPWLRLRVSGSF
jgi:hypothetical protein